MNIPELSRRFCVADLIHSPEIGAVFSVPCARHIAVAQQHWGLASDPKFKDTIQIIVQFRADKLGKHN